MNRQLLLSTVVAATAMAHLYGPVALAQTGPNAAVSSLPVSAALPAWPLVFTVGGDRLQLYEPQALSWDGSRFTARAAFALGAEKGQPTYGFVRLSGVAVSDDTSDHLHVSNIKVYHIDMPMARAKQPTVSAALQSGLANRAFDLLASDVQASIRASGGIVTPVANPVPEIVFASSLTVLVPVAGDPLWTPIAGHPDVKRAANTEAMLLQDASGTLYVQAAGSWYQAGAMSGPWQAAAESPPAVAAAARAADEVQQANPLLPQDGKPISPPPALLVSTIPTELIQTDGEAKPVAVAGTGLMTIENADHAVFLDPSSANQVYVLISGRWFTAPATSGPWTYVPSNRLPPDFARISPQDPKANVLISVTGTPQSQEAVIAATIPQTAVVQTNLQASAHFDGAPEFEPLPRTPLSYAINSTEPVIQVHAGEYYMVSNGVWFRASSPTGPWAVALAVPPEIYAIPPDSRLFYVTGVRILGVGPAGLTVGYSPVYMGVMVAPTFTVVYGTGYHYPGTVRGVWTPMPTTYGAGAGFAFGATGFSYGFSPGWSWGAGAGPHWGPYLGPTPFGRGWGFTNVGVASVYGRWGERAAFQGGWGGAGIGVSAWSRGAWGGVGGGGFGGGGGSFGSFSAYGDRYMHDQYDRHTSGDRDRDRDHGRDAAKDGHDRGPDDKNRDPDAKGDGARPDGKDPFAQKNNPFEHQGDDKSSGAAAGKDPFAQKNNPFEHQGNDKSSGGAAGKNPFEQKNNPFEQNNKPTSTPGGSSAGSNGNPSAGAGEKPPNVTSGMKPTEGVATPAARSGEHGDQRPKAGEGHDGADAGDKDGHRDPSHPDADHHEADHHDPAHPDAEHHEAEHHEADHPDADHHEAEHHEADHHEADHHEADHHEAEHHASPQHSSAHHSSGGHSGGHSGGGKRR